jgi:hypothetical protein
LPYEYLACWFLHTFFAVLSIKYSSKLQWALTNGLIFATYESSIITIFTQNLDVHSSPQIIDMARILWPPDHNGSSSKLYKLCPERGWVKLWDFGDIDNVLVKIEDDLQRQNVPKAAWVVEAENLLVGSKEFPNLPELEGSQQVGLITISTDL